jgi:hypothetical protein
MLTNSQYKSEIKIQIQIIIIIIIIIIIRLLYHTQNKAFYSCPNPNEKLTNLSHLCKKLLRVSAFFDVLKHTKK